MKTTLPILISFFLLLSTSCKKKPLPGDDDTGSPVFYATADVNGLPLKMEAGANNYYMNSSYYLDSLTNVYVYKAELKQTNCTTNCNYALTILINDAQTLASGASMNVNGAIKPGMFRFNSNSLPPLGYRATFTPLSPQVAGEEYTWTFEDGSSQTAYEVTQNLYPGTYSVKLDYLAPHALCSASHLNVFDVANPLQTGISVSKTGGLTYKFSAENPTGQGPYQYVWDFDDQTNVSNSASPSHTYTMAGRHRVMLRLTDANNNTCTTYYQLSASVNDNDCSANFRASFLPIPDTTALSAVTILFTDASGKVSSSKDFVQPSGSSFEVVSVDDYKENDHGQPTKKIKIRFSCTVKNPGGNIVIKNGEAVIAVAYKQK